MKTAIIINLAIATIAYWRSERRLRAQLDEARQRISQLETGPSLVPPAWLQDRLQQATGLEPARAGYRYPRYPSNNFFRNEGEH